MPTKTKAPPYEVLERVESQSRPGTWYEVRFGADDVLYCTCKGWCMSKESPKSCTHTRCWKARNQ